MCCSKLIYINDYDNDVASEDDVTDDYGDAAAVDGDNDDGFMIYS